MYFKFKWCMFVSAFVPLWISIVFIDSWDIGTYISNYWDKNISFGRNALLLFCQKWLNIIFIIGLVILSLFAIIWLYKFLKNKHTFQNKATPCKILNAKKERTMTSEFLLAYILPLVAFDFTYLRDVLIFLLFFSVLAFLCIRNNNIYTNIFLEFMGYKLYTCNIDYVVITNNVQLYSVLFISKNDMLQKINSTVPVYDVSGNIFINLENKIK